MKSFVYRKKVITIEKKPLYIEVSVSGSGSALFLQAVPVDYAKKILRKYYMTNERLVSFYLVGMQKHFFANGWNITSEAYKTDWYIEMSCLEDVVYPDDFDRTKTDEWEKAKRIRMSQVIEELRK